MASLHGDLSFTGRLGNLSAYTMRGHDGVVIRTRGGASKSRIRNAPSFEPTRNLNREWKGVTMVAKLIRDGMWALRPLADYNVSGPLNALVKKIQVADQDNPKGKRSILLTQHAGFISSFNFNRKTIFDSLIRQPVSVSMDKNTGVAGFEIPSLQSSVNFFPHPFYSYFRLILTVMAVSDYVVRGETYTSVNAMLPEYKPIYTDWMMTNGVQHGTGYQISPSNIYLPGPDMVLICAAGIQYGALSPNGSVQPAPYAGAAKILTVV